VPRVTARPDPLNAFLQLIIARREQEQLSPALPQLLLVPIDPRAHVGRSNGNRERRSCAFTGHNLPYVLQPASRCQIGQGTGSAKTRKVAGRKKTARSHSEAEQPPVLPKYRLALPAAVMVGVLGLMLASRAVVVIWGSGMVGVGFVARAAEFFP
jgi:hypothetical protein